MRQYIYDKNVGKKFKSQYKDKIIEGPFTYIYAYLPEASVGLLKKGNANISVDIGGHMREGYWGIGIYDDDKKLSYFTSLKKDNIKKIELIDWNQSRFPKEVSTIEPEYYQLIKDFAQFNLEYTINQMFLKMDFVKRLELLATDDNNQLLTQYSLSNL